MLRRFAIVLYGTWLLSVPFFSVSQLQAPTPPSGTSMMVPAPSGAEDIPSLLIGRRRTLLRNLREIMTFSGTTSNRVESAEFE